MLAGRMMTPRGPDFGDPWFKQTTETNLNLFFSKTEFERFKICCSYHI